MMHAIGKADSRPAPAAARCGRGAVRRRTRSRAGDPRGVRWLAFRQLTVEPTRGVGFAADRREGNPESRRRPR